jgi:uncharacterized membrane protein YvbJ
VTLGFCPSCGGQREKGALWCTHCGYSFEANPNAPQQPRPQPTVGGTRLGQSMSQGFGFGCGCLLLIGFIILVVFLIPKIL